MSLAATKNYANIIPVIHATDTLKHRPTPYPLHIEFHMEGYPWYSLAEGKSSPPKVEVAIQEGVQ